MMLRELARRRTAWDAPLKWSLGLAGLLLIALLVLGFAGPEEIRQPARIGAFGSLVTLQLLFLWGNRRDLSPYHQAQAHFIAGDYQAAREILEAIPESGRASVDALTLLGNSYRHLGQFETSGRALERALELKPEHHLALFSMGKLRLVRGDYALAGAYLERALEVGAPEMVRFELGQCYYLSGEREQALKTFRTVREHLLDEAAMSLLLEVYRYRLDAAELPVVEAGDRAFAALA